MTDAVQTEQRRPPPRPETADEHKKWLIVAAAVVGPCVIVFLLGILPLLSDIASWTCAPPTAAQLEAQRTFVLEKLPAARDVETGHHDCDDQGHGYVYFQTELTPAAARDRFLADPACSTHTDEGTTTNNVAVACTSADFRVYIFFSQSLRDRRTAGELRMKAT